VGPYRVSYPSEASLWQVFVSRSSLSGITELDVASYCVEVSAFRLSVTSSTKSDAMILVKASNGSSISVCCISNPGSDLKGLMREVEDWLIRGEHGD